MPAQRCQSWEADRLHKQLWGGGAGGGGRGEELQLRFPRLFSYHDWRSRCRLVGSGSREPQRSAQYILKVQDKETRGLKTKYNFIPNSGIRWGRKRVTQHANSIFKQDTARDFFQTADKNADYSKVYTLEVHV